MKVFFSMSFRGDVELGRRIYRGLENLGLTHTSNCYATDAPEMFYKKWTSKQRQVHFENLFKALHMSELVVLESSIHSLTIGKAIQEAINYGIPLLILTQKKLGFLDGLQESKHKLIILEYRRENVENTLSDGIDYLKSMQEIRFTMILPSDIVRHLDGIKNETGESRSEYIRKLIRKDMGEK